jgi:hypothetical protein
MSRSHGSLQRLSFIAHQLRAYLDRQGAKGLLTLATDGLFRHHFRELFPKLAPLQSAGAQDREDLRFQALTRLAKRHKQPVDLKESFTQEPDEVRFHLKVKVGEGPWENQPEITAKRLKSARQTAYRELLKVMRQVPN